MTMTIFNVGITYEIEGEWFFRILGGPFKSKEEADEFARLVGLLKPEEAPPPALGVSVSETIAMKDRFG